ncbi:MAG: hypothetical protein ABSB59_14155 [Streptosporangiaceae bacterium]
MTGLLSVKEFGPLVPAALLVLVTALVVWDGLLQATAAVLATIASTAAEIIE